MEPITLNADGQYVLSGDAWVQLGVLAIHLIQTDEGVVVDIWPNEQRPEARKDADAPISTTYAFFTEAEKDDEDE